MTLLLISAESANQFINRFLAFLERPPLCARRTYPRRDWSPHRAHTTSCVSQSARGCVVSVPVVVLGCLCPSAECLVGSGQSYALNSVTFVASLTTRARTISLSVLLFAPHELTAYVSACMFVTCTHLGVSCGVCLCAVYYHTLQAPSRRKYSSSLSSHSSTCRTTD